MVTGVDGLPGRHAVHPVELELNFGHENVIILFPAMAEEIARTQRNRVCYVFIRNAL